MKKKSKYFFIPEDDPFFKEHLKDIYTIRISRIINEFISGFNFLKDQHNTVTFFGSARLSPNNEYYQESTELAYALSKKGFTVVTGGGGGIMEGANKGAKEAGGKSVGINIILPKEQEINKYVTESETFHYFFIRKVMLSFASQAYVFFPGGFGTLDEFFEVVTLVQTNKIKKIPIVLIHKEYWQPLLNWIDQELRKKHKTVSKKDTQVYHLVDNTKEALKTIERLSKKYKDFYV